jgi:hypothetical protein
MNENYSAKGKVVPVRITKAYVGIHVKVHAFSASAVYGAEWSASHSGRFHTEGKAMTRSAL